MAPEKLKRKLTAILSADVKGYSRLMGEDEEGTIRRLNAYLKAIAGIIQKHEGRVVGTAGDSVLAEFASVVDAVRCAVEIQEDLRDRNKEFPEGRRMDFRIGVNLGDIVEEGDNILGDGVNITARVQSLAEAGGICISGTAYDHVKNKLAFGYEYVGEQAVKNIAEPVRVYRLLMGPGARKVGRGLKSKIRGRSALAFGALAALLGVAVIVVMWQFILRPAAPRVEVATKEKMALPLPDKPSIAVLPFINMSGDKEQEYLSDGMTEEIITVLSKVPYLFVISRQSTFAYKGKPITVKQVSEELGVQYVLEGSVRKEGNRVRITAQLIDALTGRHLWAERYDRDLKEILTLQDEITGKIIKGLDLKLSREERARFIGKGTDNLDAYLKILHAREFVSQFNRESNVQARQLAEEAIRLDPQYPAAYIGLATVKMMDVFLGISKSPRESLMEAIKLAEKATSLDDSYAHAHGLLGFLYVQIGEHDKGIAAGERAIERAPNSGDAHSWLAQVLNYSGRAKEAIALNEKAFRLNPHHHSVMYYQHAAVSYMLTGRYEDAVKMCREMISGWPNNVIARALLVQIYGDWGHDEGARAAAQDLLRIDPKFSAERRARSLPFKDPALQAHYLKLMRKAGLPD